MPVVQYQETDWEFVRRMASRFGLCVYPEPSTGGAKVYLGIPETGDVCKLEETGYTARVDRRFYKAGGEAAGYSRGQFLTYEVESWEDYRVGDRTLFQGKELYILGKRCKNEGSQVKFSYILSRQDWAGTRRISNEKISGMSLLGTVTGCRGETVRLSLDIDAGYPSQQAYAWNWVPPTGNVMYMMPQVGTRVSLYFKGEEESSAVAVNCIRSGNGCAGAGLGKTMGIAFAEGFGGSAASQYIIDGEIKWDQAILDGTFSSVMAGVYGVGEILGFRLLRGRGKVL